MAYKKLKYWFDKDLAILLAKKIVLIQANFKSKSFIKAIDTQVQDLELKDRVELIADELHLHLAGTYAHNINILLQILGPENEEETGMFTNFYWVMPIAKYIEKYGLADFDISMNAITEVTKRNTGEYCIRPFLQQHTAPTLKVMKKWAANDNKHIRRLASEGVRPRLPWATKLQLFIDNPKPILPILDLLKDDSSKYVQKSVANCLNDILKDNPAIAKPVLDTWQKGASKERKWIIKHALRNLRKQNDTWALQLIDNL